MKKITFILFILTSLFGCKKVEILAPLPIVETISVIHTVYSDDVIGKGEVLDNGGDTLTSRGICWSSTSNTPTIDDANATASLGENQGIGIFTCNLTDLLEGTTYYIRAYAVNDGGVAYGEVKNFTTSIKFPGSTQEINTGEFNMGNDSGDTDESPQHTVSLDTTFWMSTYEITNAQYATFINNVGVDDTGSLDGILYINLSSDSCQITGTLGNFEAISGKANYPAIEISWYGANSYAAYYGGRLPTEAEWEYAARGGNAETATLYAGSDTIDNVAWYFFNALDSSHEVGLESEVMAPNELGLYHMSGNVMEWCADYYGSTYYNDSPADNPTGPTSGIKRVVRGGSYRNLATYCEVTDRFRYNQNNTYDHVGFRPVFPYE